MAWSTWRSMCPTNAWCRCGVKRSLPGCAPGRAPHDRRQRTQLATTRGRRRLYRHRAALEAYQRVVVGRRSYDPVLGYSGAEGALCPCLSDEATLKEVLGRLSFLAPGE